MERRIAIHLFTTTPTTPLDHIESLIHYLNSMIGSNRSEDHGELIEFGSDSYILIGTKYTKQEYNNMVKELESLNNLS